MPFDATVYISLFPNASETLSANRDGDTLFESLFNCTVGAAASCFSYCVSATMHAHLADSTQSAHEMGFTRSAHKILCLHTSMLFRTWLHLCLQMQSRRILLLCA
eukprot:gnl/MRDRNA2_/MRDRNA2_91307_c0_seq1.p2 gnl/MRDRNA2_/MRDRNA2_91307_c0~~gnl/MRDRNA2_/MRDRNA2_91307_c0_seq1.p2  ORF type:complete len:105 (-),score=6.99 gnl/MRDRNA2_/MRDRNA2_91307_c0_seq1:186-500(-)